MDGENADLYKLITKGSIDEIKENILQEMAKIGNYCTEILGEGYFGKVIVPTVGPYLSVKIGDNKVVLPVAIKEAKNGGGVVFFEDVDDDLIIYSDSGITCEALVLFIISKLWYKSANIHLPFLMAIGMCDLGKYVVTHLMLERYGLDNYTQLDYNKYITDPTRISTIYKPIDTHMTNVGDILDYVTLNMDDKLMCVLPNKQKIYYPDFVDRICIFFMHTSYFIWNMNKITLGDQHVNNIFVQWINETTVCGKRSTKNIKNIYYELNNKKYLKVPTNGLIFKLGDVGCSVMQIQKNVIIVGDLANNHNLSKVKLYKKKCNVYIDAILKIFQIIPLEVTTKTKIYKIISTDKILSKYFPNMGFDEKNNKNAPTELDVLMRDEYSDLVVSSYVDDDENFVNFLNA